MSDEADGGGSSLTSILLNIAWIVVPLVLLVGGTILLTGSLSPFVTLTSDSMEPNLETGETVVVVEPSEALLAPEMITTAAEARSQSNPDTTFGSYGDVIVYQPNSQNLSIVHRVQFEVSEGDRWVDRINEDPQYATNHSCESAQYCPAPHDGYITAGDNNPTYDQLDGYQPVTDEQITGVVKYRVPFV